MSMFHRVFFAALGAMTLFLVNRPAFASASGQGVSFVGPSSVFLELAPGEQRSIAVAGTSGTTEAVQLTLSVVLFARDRRAAPSPVALPLETLAQVSPATVWSTSVLVSAPSADGFYDGTVVVTSSDGSSDSLGLTVEVSRAFSTDQAPSVPTYLSLPLRDLTLRSERQTPWSSIAATIQLDPRVVPRLGHTALVSMSGDIAAVAFAPDGTLEITADAVGHYVGHLAASPNDPGADPTSFADIELDVRDGPLVPLLVLGFGLMLGFAIEWLQSDRIPRTNLLARLAELRRRATDASVEHERWIAREGTRWTGKTTEAPTIVQLKPGGEDLVFDQSAALANDDFTNTPSPDKRAERWGAGGSEYAKIEELVASFDKLLADSRALHERTVQLQTQIPEQMRAAFAGQGISSSVREVLSGGDITTAPRLDELRKLTSDALTYVSRVLDLARLLASTRPVPQPRRQAFTTLWRRLVQLPGDRYDEVAKLEDGVLDFRRSLAEEAGGPSAENFSAVMRLLAAPDELAETIRRQIPLLRTREVSTVPVDRVPALTPTPQVLRRAYRNANAMFALFVAAAVVALGLSTQWAPNETFGAATDYLAIFVWGAAGSAVGQFVRQIATATRFVR